MLNRTTHPYLSTVPPIGIKTCLKASVVAIAALAVSACGSGAGDDPADAVVKQETKPLDHLSNLDLQRSASMGTKQMQSGVNNAQSFATQPALSDSINTSSLANFQELLGMSGGSSSSSDDTVVFSTGSTSDSDFNDDGYSDSIWDDTGVEELIDITLGLVGNADTTRDGNTMIIDPDDNELCQHSALDSDPYAQNDAEEMQFCLAMVSDLTVRIDGQTEDSGNISYLFQDETVMQIDYAANQTLFKLRLPGVKLVFDKAYSLNPEEFGSVPEVFEGVIEWGSRIDNADVGSEAGSMSIAITAPITVQDSASGFNMRVAAADLIKFEHDNAAGTASMEFDARGFLLSITEDQAFELASNGGSVKVDLINDGEQISVSKLGLANGPLTLTIDSVEVIRMTMDTFGFDIDTMAQQLVMTGNMNFNLAVNLFSEMFDESQMGETISVNASVSAPQNATFSAQPDGSIKLDNAGPFAIDWLVNFSGESSAANFSVSPGECFTEDSTGNALFSQVVCQ